MQNESEIGSIVRKMESDWKTGSTQLSEFVNHDLRAVLNKIHAYANSTQITGEYDSLGRKKPFFNIVIASENIWYRATDIDRKNIKVSGTNSKNYLLAFVATILLRNWMRKENFGLFLNKWGRTLSRFGSAILKFVEKDAGLHYEVVSWLRVICDSIKFEGNPQIEVLELTEAELRERTTYDQKAIDALVVAKKARETTGGVRKDNKNDYVRVYELHAKLPKSYLTGKEKDKNVYVHQMYAISYVQAADGKYSDFILYKGQEEKSPYMITHLIEEDDRTLARGAVESLFEAQWMVNHSMKALKDTLDLSSKLVFQTSDPAFVGQNVLSNIETGDILMHKANEPLTQLNNGKSDATQWLSFAGQWKSISNEITGISESMLGNTAPAGTAWRQVEALLKQNESLFELMRENKGLYTEDMVRNYFIPSLVKDLDHNEEITSILEDHELNLIDSVYIPREAQKRVKDKTKEMMLEGQVPKDINAMLSTEVQNVKSELSQLGNTRYFKPSDIGEKTWKKVLKDFDWSNVIVDVTQEDVDTEAITTLNTLIQFMARNPQGYQALMQMPDFKMLWNKTLALTGAVSPAEYRPAQSPQPTVSPPQTVGAGQ